MAKRKIKVEESVIDEIPKLIGATEMCLEEYLFLKAHTEDFTKESPAVWNGDCVPIPTEGMFIAWDDGIYIWKTKQEYADMIESKKVGVVAEEVVISELIPEVEPEIIEGPLDSVEPEEPEAVKE